jgi:beta-lactamase class A
MKKLFLLFICIHSIAFLFAQKTDNKLQNKLGETIKGFNGDIGIYVKNIRTGQIVSINADTIFPTAIIVNVPIILVIMDKIQKGELDYD